MSKKHGNLLITTLATMFVANKMINEAAKKRNAITSDVGQYFDWRDYRIYYKKKGEGKPLVLIHDLNPISSNYEWSRLEKKLIKNHTVYSIDLIGCGQSSKPRITYTNYFFVELITDFLKEIVKEPADIITSNDSSSFTIMARSLNPELFQKIIMINPGSCNNNFIANRNNALLRMFLYLPFIGLSFYNYEIREVNLRETLKTKYFDNPEINQKFIDVYYQTAHSNNSNGRFLYASIKSNYTNVNIEKTLKNIASDLYIIESNEYEEYQTIVNKYEELNRDIKVCYIKNAKKLPHLEQPEETIKIIETIL